MTVPGIRTKIGFAVGAIIWLAMAAFFARDAYCLKDSTCGADDMFLAMIAGLAFLAPAWIVAAIIDGAMPK